jgi:thiol-disulfide isomerase/thioredoxin
MTKRMVMVGSLIAGLAPAGFAQGATLAVPQTAAAQCRLDASNYQAKKVADLRAAGTTLTSELVRPITAEAKRIARDCANKISPDGASVAELSALSSLYLYTNDTSKAKDAVARVTAKPGMSERDRADAMVAAEQLAIATFDPFIGLNPDAERYVREVDQMSDAVLAQKVRAHDLLLARYEYADIDDGLRDHARKLLDLAQRALRTNALGILMPARPGAPSVNAAYPVMATAYSSLARGAGDFFHADSALMILDEADRVLGTVYPDEHRDLDGQRAMYKLVGTKATPIDGKWWINGTDGASLTPGDGRVTLIQFTAHWCAPCKHSYPGMLNMSRHFAGKPVESILYTDLYGFIGAKANLTPEQEVAEDRDYYTKEHGLPFKIAINPPLARGDTVTRDNNRRYEVGGVPEIIVVDQRGIIRATVVGWDNGNEKRLTALIDKILTEK